MSTVDLLIQGLGVAVQPINLLYAFIGVLLGTLVGVLPGIGPATTVALLLPMENISTETLDCVRDAVRGVLKRKPRAGTSKRPRPMVSPSVFYAAAARC